MSAETREWIFREIEYERGRQDRVYGNRSIANLNDIFIAHTCLAEEVGGLARALLDHRNSPGDDTAMRVIDEAPQVAASAVAIIENVNRRSNDG